MEKKETTKRMLDQIEAKLSQWLDQAEAGDEAAGERFDRAAEHIMAIGHKKQGKKDER